MKKKKYAKGYYALPHNYEEYPYVIIKGSNNNLTKIIKSNRIKSENQILKIRCPSHNNLTKKLKEVLGDKFERKVTEYDDDLDEDNNKHISVTRFFKLIDITETEFIDKIMQIHLSRGLIKEEDI